MKWKQYASKAKLNDLGLIQFFEVYIYIYKYIYNLNIYIYRIKKVTPRIELMGGERGIEQLLIKYKGCKNKLFTFKSFGSWTDYEYPTFPNKIWKSRRKSGWNREDAKKRIILSGPATKALPPSPWILVAGPLLTPPPS